MTNDDVTATIDRLRDWLTRSENTTEPDGIEFGRLLGEGESLVRILLRHLDEGAHL